MSKRRRGTVTERLRAEEESAPAGPGRPVLAPAEFLGLGLVLEINRRILHPIGLALAVESEVSLDRDGYFRVQVWDDRADPEGWFFAELDSDADLVKASIVEGLLAEKTDARVRALGAEGVTAELERGAAVQPIGSRMPPVEHDEAEGFGFHEEVPFFTATVDGPELVVLDAEGVEVMRRELTAEEAAMFETPGLDGLSIASPDVDLVEVFESARARVAEGQRDLAGYDEGVVARNRAVLEDELYGDSYVQPIDGEDDEGEDPET